VLRLTLSTASCWLWPFPRSSTHLNTVVVVASRSESPSGKCAKLTTLTARNNRDHAPRSLYCCLFALHSELHIQRHANRVVATTSPLYSEPHRSHVDFGKAAPSTAFTSWSQHHFVGIGKPEWQVRKGSHCGSEQQRGHAPRSLYCCLFALRTYRMGAILRAHPVRSESHIQRHTDREVTTMRLFKEVW